MIKNNYEIGYVSKNRNDYENKTEEYPFTKIS